MNLNNNNKDNNVDNSIIFFKIYRNKYLKTIIINNIRLFNKNGKRVKFETLQSYLNYEDKEYLTNIWYGFAEVANLPHFLNKLELSSKFMTQFKRNGLPKSIIGPHVKKLILNDIYELNIIKDSIPDTVSELNVGDGFINTFKKGDIPNTIKSLIIGSSYNQKFTSDSFSVDCQIESITFENNSKFNQPIDPNTLPLNLKCLELGIYFNTPIVISHSLPVSLTSLTFDNRFNSDVRLWYLVNLKKLVFGSAFKSEISVGSLPNSIETLEFKSYNKKLKPGSLPSSLKVLKMGYSFNQPVGVEVLPMGLKEFDAGYKYSQKYELNVLPPSITKLGNGDYSARLPKLEIGTLPSSLLSYTFNNYIHDLEVGILPKSIKSVYFPTYYNKPIPIGFLHEGVEYICCYNFDCKLTIGTLPNSITNFHFPLFNQPIELNTLPTSLTKLNLPAFNHPIIKGSLPNSITELSFTVYNYPIEKDQLPLNLTKFQLGYCFNSPIKSLPSNLKELEFEFNSSFNIDISSTLPVSLEILKLPEHYKHEITDPLPNLKEFYIGNHFNIDYFDKIYNISYLDIFNEGEEETD